MEERFSAVLADLRSAERKLSDLLDDMALQSGTDLADRMWLAEAKLNEAIARVRREAMRT